MTRAERVRATGLRLLRWQAPQWAAWTLAFLTLAAALFASSTYTETLAGCQALPLVGALLLTALVGGWGPAVTIAVIGAIALWVKLSPPVEQVLRMRVLISIGVPVLAASGGVAVIELLRNALASLDDERRRVAALADSQRLLFSELQHRVANNMQFISSLLSLRSRRIETAAEGRQALLDARQRVDVMARIHRRLTTPLAQGDDVAQMVEEICRDLLAATAASNIICRVDMTPVDLPLDRVSTLALIVAELFTNALKHAFVGRDGGTIVVSLQPAAGPGHYVLEVRDDGIGLAAAPGPLPAETGRPSTQRLGMRVVESLVRRLDGRFSMSSAASPAAASPLAGDLAAVSLAGADGATGTVARLEFAA